MSAHEMNDYISKILILEGKLGHKTPYTILEPFHLNTRDIVEIQFAAKKIAEFIGFKNYTFIVAVEKLSDSTGGQIELSQSSREVYVSISRRALDFQETVLTILAHEITHKYLQLNSIRGISNLDNEILTDAAAVFFGLGKIMLNGCDTERQVGDQRKNLVVGYLNGYQLAFIYKLVCNMRKISKIDAYKNLSINSKQYIKATHYTGYPDSYYLNSAFHDIGYQNNLSNNLKNNAKILIDEIQELKKLYDEINYNHLSKVENIIDRKHRTFIKQSKKVTNHNIEKTYDPCMRYLKAVILTNELKSNNTAIEEEVKKIKYSHEKLRQVISILNEIE